MRKWYHIVKGALKPSECADLVKYAQENHEAKTATVGHGGNAPASPDSNIRVSTVRWLNRADPALYDLYAIIEAHTHRANADFFGRDIRSFNDVQFTEYPSGNRYDWHQDDSAVTSDLRPFDRQLSVCIQLSHRNSYEGGEFWVNPRQKECVKDFWDIGDMVIFPSNLWHKVSPVTEGIRLSLVTWWVGPRT